MPGTCRRGTLQAPPATQHPTRSPAPSPPPKPTCTPSPTYPDPTSWHCRPSPPQATYDLLRGLPAPFGAAAYSAYGRLADWAEGEAGRSLAGQRVRLAGHWLPCPGPPHTSLCVLPSPLHVGASPQPPHPSPPTPHDGQSRACWLSTSRLPPHTHTPGPESWLLIG